MIGSRIYTFLAVINFCHCRAFASDSSKTSVSNFLVVLDSDPKQTLQVRPPRSAAKTQGKFQFHPVDLSAALGRIIIVNDNQRNMFNPISHNIKMFIFFTALHTFRMEQSRRICLNEGILSVGDHFLCSHHLNV